MKQKFQTFQISVMSKAKLQPYEWSEMEFVLAKGLGWAQMRSHLTNRIPIRVAIRITLSAPQERDAIRQEYPLGHTFHDH